MSISKLATTVPVDVAENGTYYWRQFYEYFTGCPNNEIFRAFHIPVADMKTLLEEAGDKIDAVRAYFALENEFDPKNPSAPNEIHIYLVPVKNNCDIVADENGESNVCDFTTPCPKICDMASVLYELPVR